MNIPQIETHKPSRKQAVLFFFFSLLVAVFVIAWVFFINKGTLVVEGKAPFTIKAGNESLECESSPCKLILAPRTYSIAISKNGFFDETKDIGVKRWKEEKVNVVFKLIPQIKQIGTVVLPFETAPLRPPFLGVTKLDGILSGVKKAIFSNSGEKAIFSVGQDFYLYVTADHSSLKLSLPTGAVPIFAGEEILFFENITDGGQMLKRWNNAKPEQIVSFDRAFKDPVMLGSASGKYLLIREKTETGFADYLIDLAKKTRKRLPTTESEQKLKWAGDLIIFGPLAINPDTLAEKTLPSYDPENILEIKPGILIFVSLKKNDSGKTELGVSITEALEDAKSQTFNGSGTSQNQYIIRYEVATGESKTILEIPGKAVEYKVDNGTSTSITKKLGKAKINSLTADLSGKRLYFAGDSDEKTGGIQLFEITLEE